MSLNEPGDGRRRVNRRLWGRERRIKGGGWEIEVGEGAGERNSFQKRGGMGGWRKRRMRRQRDLTKANDADGQENGILNWKRLFFVPIYLCQNSPPVNGDGVFPCVAFMFCTFLRVILRKSTMNSCKVFYSQHKLFTFRPLYALIV